LCVLYFVT